MSRQAPSAVVMIRPHKFRSNPDTSADNAFRTADVTEAAARAREEFDPARCAAVAGRLADDGREVIDLGPAQIADFAGDAMELTGIAGQRLLAISGRALASLTSERLSIVEASATPLPLTIAAIETGGGSVRCMLAGVHLARRSQTEGPRT